MDFFSAINAESAEIGLGFVVNFDISGNNFSSSSGDNGSLGGGLEDVISVPSVVNKEVSEPRLSAKTLSLSVDVAGDNCGVCSFDEIPSMLSGELFYAPPGEYECPTNFCRLVGGFEGEVINTGGGSALGFGRLSLENIDGGCLLKSIRNYSKLLKSIEPKLLILNKIYFGLIEL